MKNEAERYRFNGLSQKLRKSCEDWDHGLHYRWNCILDNRPDIYSIHRKGGHVQPAGLSSTDSSPLADARLWRSEVVWSPSSRRCQPLCDNLHHNIIHTRFCHWGKIQDQTYGIDNPGSWPHTGYNLCFSAHEVTSSDS